MSPEEIDLLKYAELRILAKSVGIKANLKADKLRSELKTYYTSDGTLETKTDNSVEKAVKTPNNRSLSEIAKGDQSQEKSTPKSRHTPKRGSTRKSTPANKPFLQSSKPAKRKSEATTTTTESKQVVSKRRKTRSIETQDAPTKKHKRSGTYDKTEEESSTQEDKENEQDAAESETDESSPGVKEVVQSLKDDMTSEQMKATLMEAIDKRAKERVEKNEPVPELGETQIPRFTALGSVKTYSHKRPVTPGNRDWSRIHQRQFDRMAGLDSYLESKKQRSEALTQSMKKMRLLTDQMRNTVNSVKSYKTPPSLLKGRAKVVKPSRGKQTTVHSNKALFPTPAKPFVPTVTSTSKANFNFSAMNRKKSPAPSKVSKPTMKSPAPVRKATKSPATIGANTGSKSPAADRLAKTPKSVTKRKTVVAKRSVATKTPAQRTGAMSTPAPKMSKLPARKSPRLSGIDSPIVDADDSPTISFNHGASAKRSISKENKKFSVTSARKSAVTPFGVNSTLNKSSLNQSHNTSVQKSKFNLSASLARPITWKAHTGRLQPFKQENVYTKQAVGVKEASNHMRAAASKNNRRAIAQKARANKRLDVQMKRRGIVA